MNRSVQCVLPSYGCDLSMLALTLIVEKDEADIFCLCVDSCVLEPRPLLLASCRQLVVAWWACWRDFPSPRI